MNSVKDKKCNLHKHHIKDACNTFSVKLKLGTNSWEIKLFWRNLH